MVILPDGSAEDPTRTVQVGELARNMVLTAIQSTSSVPLDELIREFVRSARSFYSELDEPTKPKKETSDHDAEQVE